MENQGNKYKEVKKGLEQKLTQLYLICKKIESDYRYHKKINHKDYIYFILSGDTYFRINDIIILNNQLIKSRSGFDSSLHLMGRAVLENYIYLKYILSNESNLELKLDAYICNSITKNELNVLENLKLLSEKNKFIFHDDQNHVTSKSKMQEKIDEWNDDINKLKNKYANDSSFEQEVKTFKSPVKVSKKYDELNEIDSVKKGDEKMSLEWVYNYYYRFMCMSAHQSTRDKEKIFNLFTASSNNTSYNLDVMDLMNWIVEDLIKLSK